MQKNVPKYAPDFVQTVTVWAETSKRDVAYALCERPPDAALVRQPASGRVPPDARAGATDLGHPTHLVLDLDPPEGDAVRRSSCRPRTLVRRHPRRRRPATAR